MKENAFSLLIPMALVLCLGVGAMFFMLYDRPVHKTAKPQFEIQNEVKPESEQSDTFNKKYQVLYTEDVSFRKVPRYIRKIKVKLGLSTKELRDNLIHAAWEMQKEKDARAIWIYAYRPDDIERDSNLYTAGMCILAPFGDIAKATDPEYNSVSNLTPTVDIAKVYFENIPPLLKPETNVKITQNTQLYKTKDMDANNVIMQLKKGQRAVIVGSIRNFSSYDFNDLYMIRFKTKGKKTITGWVSGFTLNKVEVIN